MTSESNREKLTTSQEILKTDFPNGFPTREEIIAKFPPKTEMITPNYSREISKASNGAIIYVAPPAK